MRRPRSLQRLFDELSRSHFAGRLGGYTVRRTPFLPSFARFTRHQGRHRRAGVTHLNLRKIRIAGALQLEPEIERRVLLHEMCHVAAADEATLGGLPHGPQWREEMRRLAREHAEAWAAREARRYEAPDVEVPRTRS